MAHGWLHIAPAFGLMAAAPQAQHVLPLTPGVSIARELSTGDVHTYQLALARGDFVRLTFEQQGIDVAAAMLGPDGREVVAVDAMPGEFRTETVVAIVHIAGTYTVTTRPAPDTVPKGRYVVHLEAPRPAGAGDERRVEAERAFQKGQALVAPRLPSAWPDALTAFEAALAGFRQVGDRHGEMKALLKVGAVQRDLSRPEALESATGAERIARDLDDRPSVAAALNVKGLAYERRGDLASALEAYEAAIAISRAMGNSRAESRSLSNAGVVFGRSGDAENAVERFEQALRLARASHNEFELRGVLNNLGIAYKDLGQFDRSLEAYEEALALSRADDDPNAQALILNNMGNVQRLLQNHSKALELHTLALTLSRQTGGKENEARSLNTIGLTHYSLGEYAKALQYHQEALAIRRGLADLPGEAASLDGTGRAWHRLGEHERALAALTDALSMRRSIRDAYGESDTLRNLAAVERDQGNLAGAVRHVEAAVNLDEELRARITSPELRATYVAAEQSKYELFIELLQQLHAANPSGGHANLAFQISERARARVLLESLLDSRVDLREGIEPALLERERSLQRQLGAASSQLSRLLARKARPGDSSDAAEKLERLAAEYQRLQAQIRQRSPRYAAVTQPRPLSAEEIQRSVVDEGTVLLEFALGEERSWLWAVTPQSITSVELPSRNMIETAVRSLYEKFTARQRRPNEGSVDYAKRVATADTRLGQAAGEMSRMLLGGIARPLNEQWRDKRLAIVATGVLEYLPFAALPVPDRAPAVSLIARHEIVMIPSASVLGVLRREIEDREPAPQVVAIVADPVFEGSDPRVANLPGPRTSQAASRGVALADLAVRREGFSRLPFSREEATAIASLADPGQAFTALDFTASRTTVLGGALRRYRLVHFATHGLVDSERPALSGLLVSLFDERGEPQNGYVRLHDIYNTRLDADLVVLSACQTALGKEIKGEGLVSLTRAFMYAGAARVVASLWQVNDHATAELMRRFYRGILQQKLPPAAALRAAQRELSRDPRWNEPYYWAGFVLQGEWRR